jgi:hypothetical protein
MIVENVNDEVKQEEVKDKVVSTPATKYLLRCKADITVRELGAIFNTLFVCMPEDQMRLLNMMPGIEFIPVPAQINQGEIDAK